MTELAKSDIVRRYVPSCLCRALQCDQRRHSPTLPTATSRSMSSSAAPAPSTGASGWERPDPSARKAGYAGKASKAAHDAGAPPAIEFPCSVFDLDFHPSQDVVCAGLVSGDINLFQYRAGADAAVRRVASVGVSTRACRKVRFTSDGGALVCATADGSVSIVAANGKKVWSDDSEHDGNPVNCALQFSSRVLATGDDEG